MDIIAAIQGLLLPQVRAMRGRPSKITMLRGLHTPSSQDYSFSRCQCKRPPQKSNFWNDFCRIPISFTKKGSRMVLPPTRFFLSQIVILNTDHVCCGHSAIQQKILGRQLPQRSIFDRQARSKMEIRALHAPTFADCFPPQKSWPWCF